eukprot:scaffold191276_cov31-Tisochrysis_lutea.AAC.1
MHQDIIQQFVASASTTQIALRHVGAGIPVSVDDRSRSPFAWCSHLAASNYVVLDRPPSCIATTNMDAPPRSESLQMVAFIIHPR